MADNKRELATAAPKGAMQMPKTTGMNVFSDAKSFEAAFKMADCLAKSTIVPKEYHNNVGNCMIALEMASRIDTSPMMVMQNLYIVNGRPAWSSQWIIAMINSSKRYKTELQFEFGHDSRDGGLSCTAWAEDYFGHKVFGPKITMKMANDEGWTTKNGSKWKTMPEVMIQYRAASFFGRLNCPDMIMGIYSADEAYEIDDNANAGGTYSLDVDPNTGEIIATKTESSEPINKEDREILFALVSKCFGVGDGNAVLKTLIENEGYANTKELSRAAYDRIVGNISKMLPEEQYEAIIGELSEVVGNGCPGCTESAANRIQNNFQLMISARDEMARETDKN